MTPTGELVKLKFLYKYILGEKEQKSVSVTDLVNRSFHHITIY